MLKSRLPVLLCLLGLLACTPKTPDSELEQYRGKWLVINYWAEWCKPCRKEIPELNQLNKDYQPQLQVLGVNYDKATGEKLQQQLKALNVDFPQLQTEPSTELGIKRPAVLPTTLIITPEGKLHATLLGPQTAETILQASGL